MFGGQIDGAIGQRCRQNFIAGLKGEGAQDRVNPIGHVIDQRQAIRRHPEAYGDANGGRIPFSTVVMGEKWAGRFFDLPQDGGARRHNLARRDAKPTMVEINRPFLKREQIPRLGGDHVVSFIPNVFRVSSAPQSPPAACASLT
jgi:hypothetical protein